MLYICLTFGKVRKKEYYQTRTEDGGQVLHSHLVVGVVRHLAQVDQQKVERVESDNRQIVQRFPFDHRQE
jgi:hypothetical protein